MELIKYFKKDFNRNIETVIKADDMSHICQEVEEYVVTKEIAKKLAVFFDQYKSYEGKNGVWISGFFGSGKSHLLKILSYVLEGKKINDVQLGEIFAKKVILEGDAKLKGDIIASTRIPSESILFNIDQQAQITSKSDANAILQVFYKVLYEHQGFYGFQPHIAEFERWLSGEGKYEEFKERFENEFGKSWITARNDYVDPMVEDAIAEVCGSLFSADPNKYLNILDKYEDKTKFSIEDFANKVNEYIKTKPRGLRLNFYVDEVGQYIAENTKLMLNLQTIAESLATKCEGRSWIIVTSQEDLGNLVGDDRATQSDDFSKIQGRFKIRIPLTSANVDEVIEKRLLAKNEEGEKILLSLYKNEKNNLATLLSFSDIGVQFKESYKDAEEFIAKYPFVSYQFDLFQQCIKSLSRHNAFQGKHASVGERSMLGVFQEVLKELKSFDTRSLVSFDQLFEGLRSTMRSEVQTSIILAENNLSSNRLAIRILKALFMVKYYDSFKSTTRNISVLLLNDLDVNPNTHQKEIDEALNLLEQQNYVQRHGDVYEFLTDVEKDIQEEIKSTDIDSTQVTDLFNTLLFDGVVKDTRILYEENKQYYDFTKKVDGVQYGREKELTIELVTPNFTRYEDQNYYQGLSMGNQTHMLMKLASQDRIVRDARLYIQTEKYIKQNQSTSNKDDVKRILFEQGQQNQERKREILDAMDEMLAKSTIYLNGTEHKVSSTGDGKTKVIYAFQDLVRLAYSKLKLLGDVNFDEVRLKSILKGKQDDLFGGDENSMTVPENEVLNFTQRRKRENDRTTLSHLKVHFSKKPYGWGEMAIWCMTAMLFQRGKIEAKKDSSIIGDGEFTEALLNNRWHGNTLVYPQIEFELGEIRKLKIIYRDLFNETNPHNEAKEAAELFKEKLTEELGTIRELIAQKNRYKFLYQLEPLFEQMRRLSKMDYAQLITRISDVENEILDLKENILDPIKQFMNGSLKDIYDDVIEFENYNQANFSYIAVPEKQIIDQVQEAQHPYRGTIMKDAKAAMDKIKKRLKETLQEEKQVTLLQIEKKVSQLTQKSDFAELSGEEKEKVLQPFQKLKNQADIERFVGNLKAIRSNVSDIYADQLNVMIQLTTSEEESKSKRLFIKQSNIKFTFNKRELESAADVEDYIDSLRIAMLSEIQKNHNITLD